MYLVIIYIHIYSLHTHTHTCTDTVDCLEPLWGSRPWRGHEENTGQARPSGTPSMMRSQGKNLTGKDKGPSRLASASTPPCILPPFLLLFLFALLRILVLPAESSPAPLSLNKDQLKTLINKSPGRWYPMKGPGIKDMLPFKYFAGILTCLINVWSHCTKCSWLF